MRCVHRWVLDDHNKGECQKCRAVRQFNPVFDHQKGVIRVKRHPAEEQFPYVPLKTSTAERLGYWVDERIV